MSLYQPVSHGSVLLDTFEAMREKSVAVWRRPGWMNEDVSRLKTRDDSPWRAVDATANEENTIGSVNLILRNSIKMQCLSLLL